MGFFDKVGGDIVGSLIGGATGLIGAKYQSDLQGHQIDRQNEYNRNQNLEMFNRQVAENKRVFSDNVAYDLSKWGRDIARSDQVWNREKEYAMELWNKQNEYNSPASQMARLKSAGLNPMLMYGQGNVGNAMAIDSSKAQPVGYETSSQETARAGMTPGGVVDKAGIFEGMLNNYMRMRQVGLMNKQLNFQTAIMEEQAERLRIDNESERRDLGIRKEAGIAKDDNMILKLMMRFFTESFKRGKRAGEYAGEKYKEFRDRDKYGKTINMDIGLPPSLLPFSDGTVPYPVNVVEPDWMK